MYQNITIHIRWLTEFVGGLAALRVIAPMDKGSFYTSIVFSMFGVAIILGPVMGGALTEHVSWRWCFYINLPLGAVTIIALFFFFNVPETIKTDKAGIPLTLRQKVKKLDLVGCALFIPAIVMLLLALEWGGNKFAWKSATIIGLFIGSVGDFAVFLVWEYFQGDEAMIPFSIFNNRSVVAGCIFAYMNMGSLGLVPYYLPEWFQIVKGASPQHSGVLMLPGVGAQVFSSIICGIVGKLLSLVE